MAKPLVHAIFPGTFDPCTNGHVSIARRASSLFHQLTVAVAESKNKRPTIDFHDRLKLTQMAMADFENVHVISFSNLLVDLATEIGAHAIVRGLRAVSDFEYEFQLAAMNRYLAPKLETVFLAPDENYAFLSSNLIKETHHLGGDISAWVPQTVLHYMDRHGTSNHR